MTWSAAQGHVFLFDLEARQRMSSWIMPASAQGYSDAAGVGMDAHFHLYVADPHNQSVRHFSAFGRHLGDLGQAPPARGDVGRDRPGVLERPVGVAVFGQRVIVTNGDRARRCGVQLFALGGAVQPPLRSCGDVEAEFGAPQAVWADSTGILVADTLAGRVQRFRSDGTWIAALQCAERGVLSRPFAVARCADGSILVADRGDADGLRLLTADGVERPLPAALAAQCVDVVALARDERGRLYVLDRRGERVLRYAADFAFDGVIVDLAEQLDDYQRSDP